jgi:hypothetical protein
MPDLVFEFNSEHHMHMCDHAFAEAAHAAGDRVAGINPPISEGLGLQLIFFLLRYTSNHRADCMVSITKSCLRSLASLGVLHSERRAGILLHFAY